DFHVTGVQTCALPIWFGQSDSCNGRLSLPTARLYGRPDVPPSDGGISLPIGDIRNCGRPLWPSRDLPVARSRIFFRAVVRSPARSEERRVGRECTSRR